MFEVILSPEARASYSGADAPLARKLARAFAQLVAFAGSAGLFVVSFIATRATEHVTSTPFPGSAAV